MDERTRLRQWTLVAAGVAMMIAALWIVLRGEHATAPTPRSAAAPSTALRIERQGEMMRLRWNPQAPDVRASKTGAIVIHDGKRESRMDLTPAELRAGAASYWPESKEVSFHLELDGGQAGFVRAAALSQDRPSPFEVKEPPRRKPHPIKRVQPTVVATAEPKRESGFGRVIGKIPLLRRLRGNSVKPDKE